MKTQFYLILIILAFILIQQGCSKEEGKDPFLTDDTGTFTDERDGSTYMWVRIGQQIWMAENMAYLPKITPLSEDSPTDPCYYVYGYSGTNVNSAKATYNYDTNGVLYNWPAAKIVCPSGWHLPSDDEWEQLAQYVSIQKGPYNISGDDWDDVGKHLKATYGWSDNTYGTDDFGFTGLPGGYLTYPNSFYDIGYYAYWWSTNQKNTDRAWSRYLVYDKTTFGRRDILKENGSSVRCVRD
jgi:uncharacterized protein (TIGR02145 family)